LLACTCQAFGSSVGTVAQVKKMIGVYGETWALPWTQCDSDALAMKTEHGRDASELRLGIAREIDPDEVLVLPD